MLETNLRRIDRLIEQIPFVAWLICPRYVVSCGDQNGIPSLELTWNWNSPPVCRNCISRGHVPRSMLVPGRVDEYDTSSLDVRSINHKSACKIRDVSGCRAVESTNWFVVCTRFLPDNSWSIPLNFGQGHARSIYIYIE